MLKTLAVLLISYLPGPGESVLVSSPFLNDLPIFTPATVYEYSLLYAPGPGDFSASFAVCLPMMLHAGAELSIFTKLLHKVHKQLQKCFHQLLSLVIFPSYDAFLYQNPPLKKWEFVSGSLFVLFLIHPL